MEVRIGTSKDCDFVLTDPTVSRVHLHLRIERDSLRVLDAGSRNGTSIDGTGSTSLAASSSMYAPR